MVNEQYLSLDPRTGPATDKRAIVILGPEKSGTRLLTKCLIKTMGCNGHEEVDGTIHEGQDPLVVRFNLPTVTMHGQDEPAYVQINHLYTHLKSKGYDSHIVITTRNRYANKESIKQYYSNLDKPFGLNESWKFNADPNQHLGQQETTDESVDNIIHSAYCEIFKGIILNDISFVFSSYEELVKEPEQHLKSLSQILGLEFSGMENIDFDITNENEKHLEKLLSECTTK